METPPPIVIPQQTPSPFNMDVNEFLAQLDQNPNDGEILWQAIQDVLSKEYFEHGENGRILSITTSIGEDVVSCSTSEQGLEECLKVIEQTIQSNQTFALGLNYTTRPAGQTHLDSLSKPVSYIDNPEYLERQQLISFYISEGKLGGFTFIGKTSVTSDTMGGTTEYDVVEDISLDFSIVNLNGGAEIIPGKLDSKFFPHGRVNSSKVQESTEAINLDQLAVILDKYGFDLGLNIIGYEVPKDRDPYREKEYNEGVLTV